MIRSLLTKYVACRRLTQRAKMQLRNQLKHLQQALSTRACQVAALRESLDSRRSSLAQRRADLSSARARMQDIRGASRIAQASTVTRRTESRLLQSKMAARRAQLLRDIEIIYPMDLVDARELLYSIVSIPLPNGVATFKPHTSLVPRFSYEDAASALAHVAQVVLLLSTYLHYELPYPLTSVGSRAVIRDGISVMSGPRAYVSYALLLTSALRFLGVALNCIVTNMPFSY